MSSHEYQSDDEDNQLRSVAMQNARSILAARRESDDSLTAATQALERKSEQLEYSLALMLATLESTTDGIVAVDQDYRVTVFNQKFVTMWRIPPDVMALREQPRLIETILPQMRDPDGFLARAAQIYALAPPETYDLLELADGRVFERFSKTQIVADRNVGRVWIFRDITARRRIEDALREETEILELLNQTGKSLTSTLDLRTLVQSVTDAATRLSGAEFGAFFYTGTAEDGEALTLYTLSGAPRAAFEQFGHPRATALFGPSFRGEGPVRSDDVLQDPRYGKNHPHKGMPPGHLPVRSYLAVPVISRAGTVIGVLLFGHSSTAVFTERTERLIVGVAAQAAVAIDNAALYEAAQKSASEREKLLASEREARAEAERMSEMKDEFLATLSHELRTPLSAILGWSQMLQSESRGEADLRKGLDTIERNARVQAKLIEDLLDMSRITAGKVRLEMQTIDPVAFIEAAVETVRPAADAKGIRLEILLDATAGTVAGDAGRLQQVIWNLLSNAIKFTSKGGTVQLQAERINNHIAISVSDTGIGIKPEFLAHVFERFRQADGSTTRRYGGLGIGLAIVKSLVELHGGTVQASSLGEGSGARFTVQLPLTEAHLGGFVQRADRRADAVALKTLELAGVRVLVVDDGHDSRELARSVLGRCNAEVLVAASGAEALALVEQQRPDVLVSDIGMPGMDGFELLRRVRLLGAARGGRVPAVALTAFARSEDRTRALHAGFLVHVSKPVDPSELIAVVASIAGRTGEPPA